MLVAAQQVFAAVHKTRFVTSFPEGACPPMPEIELPYVLASEPMHQARDCSLTRWRYEQVDVIVHQYISVQYALGAEECFA